MSSTIIGTVQNKYSKIATTNNTNALSSVDSALYYTGIPVVPGRKYIALPVPPDEINQFIMKFHATGGTNKRAQVRVTGIRAQTYPGFADEPLGTYLCTLDLVTGATQLNTGSYSAGGPYNLVERINIIDDQTNTPPGLRLTGTATGGWVELSFDASGYSTIIVELTNLDVSGGGNPTVLVGFTWSTN